MSDAIPYVSATPLPASGGTVVTLHNAGSAPLSSGIAVFGQVFAPGEVPAGAALQARIGAGQPLPAQMDVKTRWPDGSVKMAVVTVERPDLGPGAAVDLTLAAGPDAAPTPTPAVDLAAALDGRDIALRLDFHDAARPDLDLDLDAALRQALADGTASFWQQGPLATQARVEVFVEASAMRLVLDVTAFRDGAIAVDAQFANDRAMEATGGRLSYTATAALDGQEVLRETVTDHLQYQSWNARFASTEAHGGQGIGSPDAGWLNIQHDIAKLGTLGVIADYDLALPVTEATLDALGDATRTEGWGDPLAANGITKWMPTAGGRPDIGITTAANSFWLITQDARAAAHALGQAETGGAVPWRYWDAANGTWLNAEDYPKLWNQGRYGTGQPGDPNAQGPTQILEGTGFSGWAPEAAHQPDLSFVPYLLTGQRWTLDNLLAQAAWNTLYNWPDGERFDPATGSHVLVVQNVEVRAAAWAMRQLENAAWAAPDGSAEKAYFREVADANWDWLLNQIPAWTEFQGELHGYLPNYWWRGAIGVWQQDYFASVAILAASRGSEKALAFLDWMKNFLIGRFEQDTDVFNPRDGVAYNTAIVPIDPATGFPPPNTFPVKTWEDLGAYIASLGSGNGEGWDRSQGNYAMWALSTLAGIWHLTGDPRAKAAYERLADLNPPFTSAADFAREPNSAVTIPGVYGGWRRR